MHVPKRSNTDTQLGTTSAPSRRIVLGVALTTPPAILATSREAQASTNAERSAHIAANLARPECLADLMNGGA